MSKKPVKKLPVNVKTIALKSPEQIQQIHEPAQGTDGLIAMAISKGMDIGHLERLMQMRNEELARKAKQEFNQAFSRFQEICPDLVKNKQVSFNHKDGAGKTEYRYHELPDIAKHIRSSLAECGLSYSWGQHEEGSKISVWCILSHIGGYELKGEPLSGIADDSGKKNTIQQKASTISYLRRYTLTGILGLSSGESDNDGTGGAPAKQNNVVDLITLSDSQFKSAMQQVGNGTRTVDDLLLVASLSVQQEQALRKVEESRQTQKA